MPDGNGLLNCKVRTLDPVIMMKKGDLRRFFAKIEVFENMEVC